MKVSIIVPGFGKGRQIAEAQAARLREIVGENAEVLVPDGSNVGEARNRGLEMAKGEWIAWVDADDEVTKDWFPEICRAIDAAEQDGAIDDIVFDMVRVRGARETVSRYGRAAAVESKVLVDDLLRDMRLGNYTWLHVTRRRLWENERFEPLAVLEDYVTLPRILSRARKVLYIAKPLYRHIEHTGGLCGSTDKSVFFAIAVERATRFGSPAALGACVAAYDSIYDRSDRNGAARQWIRRHLLQALSDREVPLKWKVKFSLAAIGVIIRRPRRFADWVRACLKWIFKAEMWSAYVRYPDGRTVRLPMDGAKYDFCADPFLFRQGGANWLFYETLGKGRKGEIGCFKEENGTWVSQGTVLELPCHLSYPQVFELDGRIFMIPETYDFFKGSVDLYEATDFPRGWKKVRTLIPEPAVDATLLRTGGHFYLFCTFVGEHPHADLRVADSLFGEWHLHPQSGNVNQTDRLRRCAGRIQARDGRLYRVVQDCEGEYGRRVFRIPILEISPEAYREGAAELLLEDGHTYNELETPEGLLTAYDIKRFDSRPLGESVRLAAEMVWRKMNGKLLFAALSVMAIISLVVGFCNGLSESSDFQWSTARALLEGVDPYAARIGGDAYACYAPSCLLLLAPWTVLSRGSALVAWLSANIVFMLAFLVLMCRMYVAEGARVRWFAWLSLVMLTSLPFRQLLECGQHIGFSLVFFALTLWYWHKGRWFVAGLCLVPALFKYTSMVPISAVFVGLGAWRVIGVAALGHGALTILASALTRTDPVALIVGSMRIGMGNAGQGISDLNSLATALSLPGGAYAAIVGYALAALVIFVVVVRLRGRRIGRDDELRTIALLAALSCFMFYHRLYDYLVLMIVPFALPRLSMPRQILAVLALLWFFVGFRVHVVFASPASGVVVSVVMILALILVLCDEAIRSTTTTIDYHS